MTIVQARSFLISVALFLFVAACMTPGDPRPDPSSLPTPAEIAQAITGAASDECSAIAVLTVPAGDIGDQNFDACDAGRCSLRDAIETANVCADYGLRKIVLEAGRYEIDDIYLPRESADMVQSAMRARELLETERVEAALLPRIDSRITIESAGAEIAIKRIRAASGFPIPRPGVPNFKLFHVLGDGWLSLSGVTLIDEALAAKTNAGAGIYNEGQVGLAPSVVLSEFGNAIFNAPEATLTLSGASVLATNANNDDRHIAIENYGNVDANAARLVGASVMSHDGTIRFNEVYCGRQCGLTVDGGNGDVQRSTFFEGFGASALKRGIGNPSLTIDRSTFHLNRDFTGFSYALLVSGDGANVVVRNTTISEPVSRLLTAADAGYAIGVRNEAEATFRNVLVKRNDVRGEGRTCQLEATADITYNGVNIANDASCAPGFDVRAELGLLGYAEIDGQGVRGLDSTSVTLNRVPSTECTFPDQLGNSANAQCDVGAVERQP